jgi:hypothetical protein
MACKWHGIERPIRPAEIITRAAVPRTFGPLLGQRTLTCFLLLRTSQLPQCQDNGFSRSVRKDEIRHPEPTAKGDNADRVGD